MLEICSTKIRQIKETLEISLAPLKILDFEGEYGNKEQKNKNILKMLLTWKRVLRRLNIFVLGSVIISFKCETIIDGLGWEDVTVCFSTTPGLCTCLAVLPKLS